MSNRFKNILNEFYSGDEEEEKDKKENEVNNNKRPRRDNFGYFINIEDEDISSSDSETINKKENNNKKNTKNKESDSENIEDNEKNSENINENEINRMSSNISDNLVNSFKPKPKPDSPRFCKKKSKNNNINNENNIDKESSSKNDEHNKKRTSSIMNHINTTIKDENHSESSMYSNNNNFIYESKHENIGSSQGEVNNKNDSSNSYQNQINNNVEINQKNKNNEEEELDEDGAFLLREEKNIQNRHIGKKEKNIDNINNFHEEEHEAISGNSKYEIQNNYSGFKIENIYQENDVDSINNEEHSLNKKINNSNYENFSNDLAEEDEKNNSSSHYYYNYYKKNNSPYINPQRGTNNINESEIISESSNHNKEVIYSKKKLNNNKKNNIPFKVYNSKNGSPKRNRNKINMSKNNKNITPDKNMRNYIKKINKIETIVYTPSKKKKNNSKIINNTKIKNRALTPDPTSKNEKNNKKYSSSRKGRFNSPIYIKQKKMNIPDNNGKKDINTNLNTYSNLMISKTTNKKIVDSISKFSINGKISIVGFIKCLFELNIINEIFKSKDIIYNLDIEKLRKAIKYINDKNINNLKELEFIEQFWFILNPSVAKYISTEIISKMLKILFSSNSNINIITNSVVNLFNKYNNISNIHEFYLSPLRDKEYNKYEKWSLQKFVKVFFNLKNKLNISRENGNKNNNNKNKNKNDFFFNNNNKYNNNQNSDYNEDNSFDSSNTNSKKKYKKNKILNLTVDYEDPYNLYSKKSPNKNIIKIPYIKSGTPNRNLISEENIEKPKGNNIVKKNYIINRRRYINTGESKKLNNDLNNNRLNEKRKGFIPSPIKKNNSKNKKLDLIEDVFITINIKVPNGELRPFEIYNHKTEDTIREVESFCKKNNLNDEMKSLVLEKVLNYKNSFFYKKANNNI